MVSQPSRSTRYLRAFGLLALMAGIVAMHALVLGMSHADHHAPRGGMHSAEIEWASSHQHAGMTDQQAMTGGDHHDASAPGCGGDCGSGHAGMHGCLFVLTGLLLLLGLALLAWVGIGRRDAMTAKPRLPRINRARPPPWTVLSLAELAILRI